MWNVRINVSRFSRINIHDFRAIQLENLHNLREKRESRDIYKKSRFTMKYYLIIFATW